MDQICSKIKNLTLIPIDYMKKYQNYPNISNSIIACTPEIRHYLAEIIHKCAIIKTAKQFVPPEDLNRRSRDYEGQIQWTVVHANRILNSLQECLGLHDALEQPENQIRARIPEQIEQLVYLNQLLEPLFDAAQQSISSTNDRLGITDRLFGYRNNLSRNGLCNYKQRHPLELHDSLRPAMAPRFNLPGWDQWIIERPKPNSTYQDSEEFKQWKANAAERAGLVTNYPGESETRSAFTKPPRPVTDVLDNHGKVVPCRPGYRINPNPNLEDLGYKLPKLGNPEPMKSEYSISFQYPEARQANPCPWKRGDY